MGDQSFWRLCRVGDIEGVQAAIDNGADVNEIDQTGLGCTGLMNAIVRGNNSLVQLLLQLSLLSPRGSEEILVEDSLAVVQDCLLRDLEIKQLKQFSHQQVAGMFLVVIVSCLSIIYLMKMNVVRTTAQPPYFVTSHLYWFPLLLV